MIGDSADTLEIVSFMAGAFQFGVDARQINGMLRDLPEDSLAIEALLGLPLAEGVQRRCLRVGKNGVVVSEPLDLRFLPVEKIYPLPELVAARIRIQGVRALALEANGATLLLDLPALIGQGGAGAVSQ